MIEEIILQSKEYSSDSRMIQMEAQSTTDKREIYCRDGQPVQIPGNATMQSVVLVHFSLSACFKDLVSADVAFQHALLVGG